MGMRGSYHKQRVAQLVENFKKWHSERSPGIRAFQSTYDRYVELYSDHFFIEKPLLELGPPFVNGFISLYTTCMLYQHSTTFFLSWWVFLFARMRDLFILYPSLKSFALPKVKHALNDADLPCTNFSDSQGQ